MSEIGSYQNEWAWPLFRGRLKWCQQLLHNSHSPLLNLNIQENVTEAWFQRTTTRKWSHDRCHHVTPKDQTCYPNTLRAQYLENSWRCYLTTIAQVCCDAVRSSIIAKAWLLVGVFHGLQCVCENCISHSCRHSVHIWFKHSVSVLLNSPIVSYRIVSY